MVYRDNAEIKWMIWGYPHFRKHPCASWISCSKMMISCHISRLVVSRSHLTHADVLKQGARFRCFPEGEEQKHSCRASSKSIDSSTLRIACKYRCGTKEPSVSMKTAWIQSERRNPAKGWTTTFRTEKKIEWKKESLVLMRPYSNKGEPDAVQLCSATGALVQNLLHSGAPFG